MSRLVLFAVWSLPSIINRWKRRATEESIERTLKASIKIPWCAVLNSDRTILSWPVSDRNARPSNKTNLVLGIISLGDSNAYLLSTAEEHLGVIAARSAAGQYRRSALAFISVFLVLGEKMVPISDCQMNCPVMNVPELRKVAKIQSDLVNEVTRLT